MAQRLVKQLIGVLNNPDMDRDIKEELDLILTPVNLSGMTNDQKDKITQLHDFLYGHYDGGPEETVGMYRLILSVIRSLKSGLSVQYELYFWLNKTLTADPRNYDLLLHLTRSALQAKMVWPVETNHSWTGNSDLPSYQALEEQLILMYGRFLQDLGYDIDDPSDFKALCGMCYAALDSL